MDIQYPNSVEKKTLTVLSIPTNKPVNDIFFSDGRTISRHEIASQTDLKLRYQKEALEWHLGKREPIKSTLLCEYLIKHKPVENKIIFKSAPTEVLAKTITVDLLQEQGISNFEIPDALWGELPQKTLFQLAECQYDFFSLLPKTRKTERLFLHCLKHNYEVIEKKSQVFNPSSEFNELVKNIVFNFHKDKLADYQLLTQQSTDLYLAMVSQTPNHLYKVPSDWVDYKIIAKAALKSDNTVFIMIPESQRSRELVNDAVSRYPAPTLDRIPREFRDYNTIEQAIRHCNPNSFLESYQEIINTVSELPASAIQCRFWLHFVPDSKKTEENIEQYLKNYPSDISKIPHHLLIKNRAWCENAVLDNYYALVNIPKEHLDYELCLLAISQNGNAIKYIPETLLSEHPELLDKAIKSGASPYDLSKLSSSITADDIHANPKLVTKRPYSDKSLWATMIEEPAQIPRTLHARVIEQQDTCNLQHLPITGLLSSSESLCKPSDPIRRDPIFQPVDPVLIELKKRLIRCKPLALPNATTGAGLQQYIADHYQKTTKALANHSLPTSSIPTSAKAYGGRTLLSENPDKTGCDRYKFLRKDEPLDEFFREEAVHQFCNDTHEGKILTSQYLSEVPKSKGIALVQKTETVSTIINQFTSQPEVITINNQDYYLVYHFHTRDKSYSDQANQPLENRSLTENIQALKNAAHTLGQWMSCGAVHTSTIQAFHNFEDHRRELFLTPLFSRKYPATGCLSFWNTKATDQSDFVLSGLKDLGDMEFYPHIETYSTARSADYFIPGYAQRCSFMEGFVSNMVAITLNYCRLLQTEADFHYRNQHAVSAMKAFITDITNQYLTGLFGTPTTAASLFPNDEVYHQWLNNTALETIYWTAQQSDDNDDCVFQHLKTRGELSREVYPDWQGKYYYHCTHESKAHSLGLSDSSFPLTSLVKGLAQIAGGMAEKLQPQSE